MKLYIIIFLSLVNIGCKSQKTTANVPEDALESIVIYESACEGTCPVYTMTIFSNGSSRFNGEEHTNKIGTADYSFSKESIAKLFMDLKKLDFDSFKEKPNQIVDIPETKITYNNKTIIIKDIRAIPEDFKTVVSQLKTLTRSTGFVN